METFIVTEEWALSAPAGPELDRVCAEWMDALQRKCNSFHVEGEVIELPGWEGSQARGFLQSMQRVGFLSDVKLGTVYEAPCYSTSWEFAGPLLEAMQANNGYYEWFGVPNFSTIALTRDGGDWVCGVDGPDGVDEIARASKPQLAIARTCAVLVARNITREQLVAS